MVMERLRKADGPYALASMTLEQLQRHMAGRVAELAVKYPVRPIPPVTK